jgi:hypothetical protein
MGRIKGNKDFGLEPDQVISMIAAESPEPGGVLSIFWTWFLNDQVGMLFCEANYVNSLSSLPQLLDYTLFWRDAPVTDKDFSNPCSSPNVTFCGEPKSRLVHPRNRKTQ